MEWIETFSAWFMSLGEQYGVNPILFGAIYVGAIPFFTLSVGWVVRNQRREKSIVLPVLSALFFFVSAYIYLIVAGENVPVWVYGIIVLMIIYGGYSTIQKIRRAVRKEDSA